MIDMGECLEKNAGKAGQWEKRKERKRQNKVFILFYFSIMNFQWPGLFFLYKKWIR